MVAHVVSRNFLDLSDAYSIASQTCKSVHLIKFASKTGIGFRLSRPQKAVHFLPHGKHFS